MLDFTNTFMVEREFAVSLKEQVLEVGQLPYLVLNKNWMMLQAVITSYGNGYCCCQHIWNVNGCQVQM